MISLLTPAEPPSKTGGSPALPFLFTSSHLKLHQAIAPLPPEGEVWWEHPGDLTILPFVFSVVHWTG